MRFFRGFVSCCCTTDPTSPTMSLVPPPTRTLRRKKRGVSHWRPSLGTISEDATSPHTESVTAASGGDVKKTSSSAAATANVPHSYYSDHYDYGQVTMPSVMPAFSPTPFMF